MRIGAIFARGSCRALKWMALFGVLFALGAANASAQVTATLVKELAEGASTNIEVTFKMAVGEGTAAGTFDVTATEAAAVAGEFQVEDGDVVFGNPVTPTTATAAVSYPAGPADDADTETALTTMVTRTVMIPIQAAQGDPDAEDEKTSFTLSFSAPSGVTGQTDGDDANTDLDDLNTPDALELTIKDDDGPQMYVLEVTTDAPMEGAAASLTLKAMPPHEDAGTAVTLHLSDPVNYSWDNNTDGTDVRPARLPVGNDAGTVTNSFDVYVTPPDNDKNRMTDTVTLTGYSGSAGNATMVASVDIAFADLHMLAPDEAVTAVAMDKKTGADAMEVMEVTEGGDPVYLTISVDRGKAADKDATTTEALTVDVKVAPAYAADVSVTPTRVTFPMVETANGAQKGDMMVELMALSDEDVGMEEIMLDLVMMGDSDTNGAGSSTGMFSIMVVDETVKKIAPKTQDEAYPKIEAAIAAGSGDDGLNPGDMFEVMTGDLFTLMDGYTASYGASVEGDSVSVSVSGEMVMVEALTAASP